MFLMIMSPLIKRLHRLISKTREPEDPIRAELFSIERLEQHAESLATEQRVSPKRGTRSRLLARVKDNARVLTQGYRGITRSINERRAITPASEWLVDNFHVIEDQIREIIDDLPPGFYRRLPKLAAGFLEGTPRVYGVAWAFIAHTDSRFDPDWLRRFVRAYQRADALSIGEIWALAISLRIVLVENLRRLSEIITTSEAARLEADELADSLLRMKKEPPVDPAALLRRYDAHLLQRPFAVQLAQRLRDQGESVAPALQWLDQRLEAQGTTAEDIVRLEHQEQAAMTTTVRNVITSMRLISAMDWAQFFEDVAAVDEVLRSDSGFASMDFPSRDNYRHAIEELARGSDLTEVEVAKRAVRASRAVRPAMNASTEPMSIETARQSDPGYFLVSKGRIQFEKEIKFQVPLKKQAQRFIMRSATPIYLGAIILLTALFLAIPLYLMAFMNVPYIVLFAFEILGIIPASNAAVALANCVVTNSMQPETLAKLDFSSGIPDPFKTLVVTPTLLTSLEVVEEQLGRLEIHHLSDPDAHLQFALLTDWGDAAQEHGPDDKPLLERARQGIKQLNDRYGPGPDQATRFFIFHRRRLWNPKEGVWMGWERKRGKLHELNRLLRGDTNTTFVDVSAVPSGIRYVITLDADTHMPHGAAPRLVGAMAHPLNRPSFDPALERVVEGYGVMQPRITPTLPTAGTSSLYQQIYSGPAGIDPYAFAVSDVYQDLFKEGSYIGKGIYDVDAFESALRGRVSENTMLSHDLFEGLYARTALLTDIELFEEFPPHFEVAAARNHRWVRGDWQLLPWILERKKKLPLISRWKMVDNLRRSLSPPSIFLALICAWFMKNTPSGLWMGFILTSMAIPSLLPVLIDLLSTRRHFMISIHFKNVWEDFKLALTQLFLAIVFTAHQAWVMSDAALRTLYRLTISHRHLLEWTSAAISKNHFNDKACAFYGRMKGGPLLAVLTLALAAMFTPRQFWCSTFPFVLAWILSPWIAQRLSLPKKDDKGQILLAEDRRQFRLIARKNVGIL